jgi:hypothetical protein
MHSKYQKYLAKSLLLGLIALCGCHANLEVRKVQPGCHGDSVKGYRYYLGRPYVVVKSPILVSETLELVRANLSSNSEQLENRDPDDNTSLDTGQIGTKPNTVEYVSTNELLNLRSKIKSEINSEQIADSKVRQASFTTRVQDEEKPSTMSLPEVKDVGTRSSISAGQMEIIYLPDFDEQYAVHDRNRFGKSSYGISFRDGWELVSVNGEFDSSAVAVEILNTIETAIKAAQTVAEGGIDREKAKFDAANKSDNKDDGDANKSRSAPRTFSSDLLQKVTRTYIKPGVYRINKPWEVGDQFKQGSDLLANMGLSTYHETSTVVAPATKIPMKDKVQPLAKPQAGAFSD